MNKVLKRLPLNRASMLKLCSWLVMVCLVFTQAGCAVEKSPYEDSLLKTPRQDFIVGMWSTYDGDPFSPGVRKYVVFRSDGTGRFKSYVGNLLEPNIKRRFTDFNYKMQWSYDLNGVWKAQYIFMGGSVEIGKEKDEGIFQTDGIRLIQSAGLYFDRRHKPVVWHRMTPEEGMKAE